MWGNGTHVRCWSDLISGQGHGPSNALSHVGRRMEHVPHVVVSIQVVRGSLWCVRCFKFFQVPPDGRKIDP